MKYVWILVAIIILVRIDMVLNFVEKTFRKVNSSQETELKPGEVPESTNLIPLNSDLTLKVSPRNQFLSLLGDFYVLPDKAAMEKGLEILKNNPTLFNEKLDRELEVKIYRWREHIQQKNKVVYEFIFAMMKILKGENLEMLKRFSTLLIDYDLPEFLNYTSLSSDTSCLVSISLADSLPEEEKYNELVERLTLFQTFINSQGVTPGQKMYAEKCFNLIKFQVDKMKPTFEPSIEEGSAEPTASPTSAEDADQGSNGTTP
jgi:hypothetical protein